VDNSVDIAVRRTPISLLYCVFVTLAKISPGIFSFSDQRVAAVSLSDLTDFARNALICG
jgi:hypothetical protein